MLKCNFNEAVCNFIEITLRHGSSPVNLLHIFRTPFPKNTCGGIFLKIQSRLVIKQKIFNHYQHAKIIPSIFWIQEIICEIHLIL